MTWSVLSPVLSQSTSLLLAATGVVTVVTGLLGYIGITTNSKAIMALVSFNSWLCLTNFNYPTSVHGAHCGSIPV